MSGSDRNYGAAVIVQSAVVAVGTASVYMGVADLKLVLLFCCARVYVLPFKRTAGRVMNNG